MYQCPKTHGQILTIHFVFFSFQTCKLVLIRFLRHLMRRSWRIVNCLRCFPDPWRRHRIDTQSIRSLPFSPLPESWFRHFDLDATGWRAWTCSSDSLSSRCCAGWSWRCQSAAVYSGRATGSYRPHRKDQWWTTIFPQMHTRHQSLKRNQGSNCPAPPRSTRTFTSDYFLLPIWCRMHQSWIYGRGWVDSRPSSRAWVASWGHRPWSLVDCLNFRRRRQPDSGYCIILYPRHWMIDCNRGPFLSISS